MAITIKGLVNYIQHPTHLIIRLAGKGMIPMADKTFLKLQYKQVMGEKLNIEDPKSFNEKLQWLKLYDRRPEYTIMVDKCAAKDYVARIIGEEYIIPTFGVWSHFDDIDFDKLPNQFVLKCTHDSGGVVFVKDKDKFDENSRSKARETLEKHLAVDYYLLGREWPYKNVPRRIIAEKYIEGINQDEQLCDYKFMCFNGKVHCLFTCTERGSEDGLKVTFFDRDWNILPFERHYPKSKKRIERPERLEEMIFLSEKLSESYPFIRVDFYEINGKIYFGELTLYPGNGMEEFTPKEADRILGDLLDLKGIRKECD